MRWTLILGGIGLIIGIFVGSDAAQTVDLSTGGAALESMLQYKVFKWVTGMFAAGGLLVGFIIDVICTLASDASRERRFGRWTPSRSASTSEVDDAIESIRERQRRRQLALASGESPREIDAAEAAAAREADEAHTREYWKRVEAVDRHPRIPWSD